jgi:hypothetical protein
MSKNWPQIYADKDQIEKIDVSFTQPSGWGSVMGLSRNHFNGFSPLSIPHRTVCSKPLKWLP